MSDETTQAKFYISPELHRLVNADPRKNSDVAEAALWNEFGGERKGALEQRIEEIENREEMIEEEIQNRKNELEELRNERENYIKKIEKIENGFLSDKHYEQARELLDKGERIYETHDFIDELTSDYDRDRSEIHNELKDNLDYPDVAFRLRDYQRDEPFDWREVVDNE